MTTLNIPDPNGLLYVVADSHLDNSIAPAEEFVEMLSQLENPHTVVFLGDLFRIWLAPQKYWTDLHHEVMSGFEILRKKGCNVVFIVGNREMLLPRKLDEHWQKILPFTHLSHREWYLNWGKNRYAFIHGDTINYNDRQYLKWKAFTHNRLFETFFKMIPGSLARLIAGRLEEILSDTNKEYKSNLPEIEIKEFAESVLDDVDQYFVGHFHIDRVFKVEGCGGVLRIVPDWLSQRKILKISVLGETEVLHYKK